MAALRELIIKISANSQSFQSEIARASRMGSDYYRTMQNGSRQAAASAKENEKALAELTDGFASAGRAAAAAGAAFATGKLVQIADEWTSVNARLKQASSSTDDFTNSQLQLMQISQRTGTAFSDNANLFSRAAASMREFGYDSADVLRVTEAVSTGLKISGASAEESGSVITQFSQALAQGVLRGEEFNAVNESGDRVVRALAAGMGVARKDLKAMADQGQLTIDKVVPAIVSQLETLRGEFSSMPQTVSGSMQRVTNSFMAWVGGVNQATGATAALSGGLDGLAGFLDGLSRSAVSGALDDVANNMTLVTTAATGLVGIGLAKYLSGIVTSATGATASLISAAKAEVALAVAQERAAQSSVAASRADVYRAQQALQSARGADIQAAQQEKIAVAEAKVTAAQARLTAALASGTATEKVRARAALERAQSGLAAAKNADVQAAAERRLASAQAALKRNLDGRITAQNNLNSVTSVGTRLMGGAMGLIGGVPGLVMLGAGAWYALYQSQEQARQSAQEYAKQIDQIREKTSTMSLPDVEENRKKTVESLAEIDRQIAEQQKKITQKEKQVRDLNTSRGKPGITGENDLNIVRAITIVTGDLAVEEDKLNNLREQARIIQQALAEIERRRTDQLREQAWKQNQAYQSLLMMNGQHSELNRLLSLGNQLLSSRGALVNAPMRLPQAPVSTQDQQSLIQKQQQAELAGLTGLARIRKQAQFDLEKMGRTGPENSTYAADYVKAAEAEYNNAQRVADAQRSQADATRDAGKAAREAAQTAEQYSRKMADLSIATEVQKVRATQGEQAAELFAASHESGTKWSEEQRKSIEAGAVALAQWSQKADEAVRKQREMTDALKDLKDAARRYQDETNLNVATSGMGSRDQDQYRDRQEVERVFDKTDKGAEAVAARASALDALDKKYQQAKASELDWRAGVSAGLADWMDNVSNIAGTVSQGITSTMDSALGNVASMLVRGKADWKEWGLSAMEMIAKVSLQMAAVSALGGSSSSGILGTLASSVAGAFGGGAAAGATPSGAYTAAAGSLTFNAKGGVYDSPSLSAFSNSIVDTPTFFAFAKGAGVMGEAGPEAIMPLTRAADGSLGVRAVSSGVNNATGYGNAVINVHAPVNITQDGSAGEISNANTASTARQLEGIVQQTLTDRLRKEISPGGILYRR
ncbi:phage tail tape measure protein [Leclercia adecarboxylata]|uniref:phage tail tape measure protein n=1 Tax=Leclercia adecarboxylata TaxID=83655 RepID=UPI0029497EB9|nr:phage tail tape measure protein [Leclercia adecarboxylata]MDV5239917.1 phage tail tape measure protein [Leclercia adecarboxylata]MDV5276481.1 phage tail tape measure protein [Leclercia adecarboxylata]MDV5460936.1 phage tail tape measure protein [Leclercia adecarboxylata]MDV5503917.1 phage tail tape measure protein [Leclercia adecarboxylata]MDV5533815.1 phage tail tape measure protein [Leclercia adecarboxylata]